MAGWDQRAVALVVLRGTATDRGIFEAEVAAQGWDVLERDGPAATPTAESTCAYLVEVRFPGSGYRATTGARERLEAVADRLVLDMVVEAVQLVERDPLDLPVWHGYQPPRLPPCTTPVPLPERVRERAATWWAVTLGPRDTGRQVRAESEAEARALAGRALPGAPPAPNGSSVRRSMGTGPRPAGQQVPRRRGPARQFAMVRFPVLLALLCGAWTGALWGRGPGAWWPVLPCLAVALAGAAVVLRRAAPALPASGVGAAAFALVAGVCVIAAHAVATAPDTATGFAFVAVGIGIGSMVGTGVWLLVRQSSWGRALPWLLPAALPLVVVLLPGFGLTLPAAYLDSFGVDLEDVEVPAAWRVIGALKVVAALALWLLAPAFIGYAKHLHYLVKDRWMAYTVAGFLLFYCTVASAWALALQPAAAAGARAVAAAAEGRTPPFYYGIKPEWMCVWTVADVDKVPVEGGRLARGSAYLLLGDAGGTAVLWDAREKQALKVPLAFLRLVPADAPRQPCG
ncbi:hypothetical protein [Streptomyces subrutilus]|uniref:NnrS multi-domain protein n=1 Tax=Streptomyces subrutilus TaxID=36818 RepID=A0A1E5PSB6_9ACTN|nr:hypothetical protein [Streptomyces subrutilus]OEJ32427.1 hypothetical protein BGK67_14805 [Streptomyces subrutilus]